MKVRSCLHSRLDISSQKRKYFPRLQPSTYHAFVDRFPHPLSSNGKGSNYCVRSTRADNFRHIELNPAFSSSLYDLYRRLSIWRIQRTPKTLSVYQISIHEYQHL